MFITTLFVFLTVLRQVCDASKVRYISTEHPEITRYNPNYVRYVNLTAQRRNRADPFYYVGCHVDIIWPVYNNVNVDISVYEILADQHKHSILEQHCELCQLLEKDIFFGFSLGVLFPHACPLEPGPYHIENVTIPLKNIPEILPFMRGRFKANFTSKTTKEVLGCGHIDVEVKYTNMRRAKNNNRRIRSIVASILNSS